mmetsp:Transcript_25013/g.41869  ORF Transcript_25013/g.41869 Transcript_25013/m.41869 type:complete len:594 (+) Transcript_25013:133-1914(+)
MLSSTVTRSGVSVNDSHFLGSRVSNHAKSPFAVTRSASRSAIATRRRQRANLRCVAATGDSPHVAVVGAGWGGWGAAKALCEAGCRVTLLDGLPDPTGASPYLTPTGKPFEAGTRGFWKDYPNVEDLVKELGLREEDVFTEFTPSSFYSPDGLEAVAPVFGESFELPSPLGQVFATFDNFKRLPLSDRVTMGGLLYAMIDFTRDQSTFEAYDRMTAHDLFIRMGLSKRLVDDFVRPTLLVGLFKPPEELSAAVVMELLYYYALAHQTSFDVRWIKNKSIAEMIINPLAERLTQQYDISVKGGSLVQEIMLSPDKKKVTGLRYKDMKTGGREVLMQDIDACVMALGSKGMKSVVGNSPALAATAPELSRAAALGGIDVVATRIWLDRFVKTDTPANVLSRFEALRGAGGTFFMLDQLQPDHEALWGKAEVQGSVLACDFYNGGAIATLSDEDIIKLLMEELLPEAVPEFKNAKVVDSYVQRYYGAVSWFSPGSYASRPPLEISTISNLVCAGDWVKMGAREHGAKGLCQERAYVSGLQAANALAAKGALGSNVTKEHPVIPIRKDEPQVELGRKVNKTIMDILNPLGLASPWVR